VCKYLRVCPASAGQTMTTSSGWSDAISFSYDDGNQVVVLPAELEDGRIVRLARIDSSIARIFCTDTNTERVVMWPEELGVSRVGWRESVRVPVHREQVFISCSEKYVVYKFGLRIALIEPERRQRVQFSLI
jgi:hypothetical protein